MAIATGIMGCLPHHFRRVRLYPVHAVTAAALLLGTAQIVRAGNVVLIKIKTQPVSPLPAAFSGFNVPQPRNGVEYFDPKFVAAVTPLKPGWLRFPAGTSSMAFDWNAGHLNQSWLNSLITGNPAPVTGQAANILTVSQQLTQAKGGVWLSDFATFANTLGSPAIMCFNTFTDTNPGSATQMALAAQSLGINVLEWELGNEPYLYPAIYASAPSYAAAVYSPYFTDLLAGAPTATVGLFSAGSYTGDSFNACPGLYCSQTWDSQLSAYTPRYWNASSTHIYPVMQAQSAESTIQFLNGILAHGSSDYINTYLAPLVGSGTPIFITEFNCCSSYNIKFSSYVYNGVFLAEYIARLSSVPGVKGVGVNSLYTDNADYHGVIQSVNDFESYLIGQVTANPNFSTNTATDPNTQFQFYTSAPGLALEVANQAINSSSQVLPTTVTGGLTVNITGFDGQPIPSVFAQAYMTSTGSHYLLVTNKAGKGQEVAIAVDGVKLTSTVNVTYVYATNPVASNTAQAPTNVHIHTATSSNLVFVRPYSVTSIQW